MNIVLNENDKLKLIQPYVDSNISSLGIEPVTSATVRGITNALN